MELRPILSAMLRNKTGAILVGLQIAITLAVVANAVFIIMQRVEKVGRPPGIDSGNLFFVQSYGYGPTYNHRETVRRDLDTIRALPGVIAATPINGIPMSGGGAQSTFGRTADPEKADVVGNYYTIDERGIQALGVTLQGGRAFNEAEIQYNSDSNNAEFGPAAILSEDMAHALFGDEPAVGKALYDGYGRPATVVGVIENMIGAWVGFDNPYRIIFVPRINNGPVARYAVRVQPGQLDALMAQVERKLSEADIGRAITWVRPHSYYVTKSYRADYRMVAFLSVIAGLMILITALGIVGLASFQVNVRTKQIGTRRAVGARKADIIRYFMLENWLLTSAGVFAGAILAFAFGHWLSSAYALPRLQYDYVVGGAVVLWILGQLAVFVPALRAAAIPPAIATRTV